MKKVRSKILRDVSKELDLENMDDEFDGDDQLIRRKIKSLDEVAIDEMLVGLQGNDWYLKLSKEIMPNVFQFKKRIDKFRHWADMELEINNMIRAETQDEYKKTGRVSRWGSGKYQVVFFREGGLRGDKKHPVFFDIDAEEPEIKVPSSSSAEVELVKEILNNRPQLDPQDAIKLSIDSLHKGMELATNKEAKIESGNNNMMTVIANMMAQQTQSMATILAAILGKPMPQSNMSETLAILKDAGILQPHKAEKPLIDTVKELQILGIIRTPNEDDAAKSIEKVKQFMSLASDFAGAAVGERPGILEKLIDVLGPKVAETISNVTNLAVIKAQQTRQRQRPQMQQSQVRQTQQVEQEEMFPEYDEEIVEPVFTEQDRHKLQVQQSQPQQVQSPQAQPISHVNGDNKLGITQAQINEWKRDLYTAITTKDYTQFSKISEILGSYLGGTEKIKELAQAGTIDARALCSYILLFDTRYIKSDANILLLDYTQKYIDSFRVGLVIVTCSTCNAEHEFDNKQSFLDEAGENEGRVICGINGCENELHIEG